MEQLEVINKIKTHEQEAQRIIDEAKHRASQLIKEAKFIQREEILKVAKEEAQRESEKLKQELKLKLEESLKQQSQLTKQNIERIKAQASKNKDKARDYIVDEVLKIWQLPR